MPLLKTKDIQEGALLALTADPSDGPGSLMTVADPERLCLRAGDIVQVVQVDRSPLTSWARVTVAVVRGAKAGRVGHVTVDLSPRVQRCWQSLTLTGSVEAARLPPGPR